MGKVPAFFFFHIFPDRFNFKAIIKHQSFKISSKLRQKNLMIYYIRPCTVTEFGLSSVVLMVNGLPDPRACTWDFSPVVTSLSDRSMAAKFLAFSSF